MGVVHRATDTRLNRQVAVKVLNSAMAADVHARERLRREALAAASLDHPYVGNNILAESTAISENGGVR